MITVTPAARTRLAEALDNIEEPTPDEACFRIVRGQEDQLTLAVGVPNEEDVKIEEQDKTVLAIAPTIAEVCADRTLDVEEGGPGGQSVLTLR
jgi:hypothetical protein